jgi:protoporphyrinogen oxidase
MKRTAIIIGAGPAGLTAAFELLTRSDIVPIVLEKSTYMGGISRTIEYKGNRMDIGGHRFFSKSDRVMEWWQQHLPIESNGLPVALAYQNQRASARPAPPPADADAVMLVRRRKSRIYFLRKFFDYPIRLTVDTLRKMGLARTMKVGFSYARSVLLPIRPARNLEQFFINRFGRQLYRLFFQSYTEKVWGVPCDQISAEWGEQRIKGLSIRKAIGHFLKQAFRRGADIAQKTTETSLIEQFLYPKFGPGQMWEEVARKVVGMGGTIVTEFNVEALEVRDGGIASVSGAGKDGERRTFAGDYFFSTMPIKELVASFSGPAPAAMRALSDGLMYRDFITVGVLVSKLKVRDEGDRAHRLISDNWIYIQEPEVLAGRLQIFNNWSPHMVSDSSKVWLGVEYFCYETDELWRKSDRELGELAIEELARIDIIDKEDALDFTVARMPKTYPAYFGDAYARFDELRAYLDGFANLFLVGRNGMHKYNNQDHSMLTAMTAVDNILAGRTDKANLWAVNTEMEYHEAKSETSAASAGQ